MISVIHRTSPVPKVHQAHSYKLNKYLWSEWKFEWMTLMCLLPEGYIWAVVCFNLSVLKNDFAIWIWLVYLKQRKIFTCMTFLLSLIFWISTAVCPPTKYGPNCELQCTCKNGGLCNPVDGSCTCALRWTGDYCEKGKLITTFFYSMKSTAYCHSLIKYGRNLWRAIFQYIYASSLWLHF